MSGKAAESAMIFDGMTRKGYVPERQYVSQAVRFWYRPMTVGMRAKYLDTIERQTTAVGRESVSCGMLALQLTDWDIHYAEDHPDAEKRGQKVPTNDPDLIYQTLDPFLQRAITGIVVGMFSSAPDPQDSVDERVSAAQQEGLTPRQNMELLSQRESEQLKN
jgi:hypothetical protein